MLHSLEFKGVGPAVRLGPIHFRERLNLLTGDNGLGKTFVLDTAWWALTGMWPDPVRAALPDVGSQNPTIAAKIQAKTRAPAWESTFDFVSQRWPLPKGRPSNPGLVLYFRVDGQFSLWDPTVHYWRKNKALGIDDPDRPNALSIASGEAWDGITRDGKVVCRGLIEDWVSWQQTRSQEFDQMLGMLRELSPQAIAPASPRKIWLDDPRDHPVLRMPGGEVPLTLLSAGMKRILGVAYLLVWAWQMHRRNAELTRQEPETRITVLFDEPETHLHPQWQRRILPGLMRAIAAMDARLVVQFLVGTHSPLVLASMESLFDDARDALFHFELEGGQAQVERVSWAGRGDVSSWLVSPIFGLEQARSVEAERAIESAERFMRGEGGDQAAIHAELQRLLPGADRFWPRWIVKTRGA